MYVRLYILLLVVRVYFALQPSYIHPDEHFQGPEIITGLVFGWPSHKTWEFTSEYPIRSVFPLYLAYGFPLTILKWIYEGLGYEGQVPTWLVFYTLRAVMFGLNFVLEDWALHELIHQPRERKVAVLLVASSYVTWCFQAHTFSNSLETLLVLWALVLIGRLRESAQRTKVDCCIGLAFIGVLGVFNRITFPAWILVPGIQLLAGTHLFVKPLRLPIMLISALFFLVIAVDLDTQFYLNTRPRLRSLFFDRDPSTVVFTPWNNLRYNLDTTNLAEHGLHPLLATFRRQPTATYRSCYSIALLVAERWLSTLMGWSRRDWRIVLLRPSGASLSLAGHTASSCFCPPATVSTMETYMDWNLGHF